MYGEEVMRKLSAIVVGVATLGAMTLAVAGCGGSSEPAHPASKPSTTQQHQVQQRKPAAKPQQQKAATKPATPPPQTLMTMSGQGIKSSPNFTAPGDWTLKYNYDCSNFGQSGNFQVYEDYPTGDVLVNELDNAGASSTAVHDGGGTHSLEVNSECRWTVTAVG
jgi:hypothetical protein